MVATSLTSFRYWDIGENRLNWVHLRHNRRFSQKQNDFFDVFTMVHHISDRHIQAVMNNLKFIILDYLAAKKSGILDWRSDFCDWSISSHYSLYMEGNALEASHRVQYAQGYCSTLHTQTQHLQTETLVRRCTFSGMFNVICYARVWRNNRLRLVECCVQLRPLLS